MGPDDRVSEPVECHHELGVGPASSARVSLGCEGVHRLLVGASVLSRDFLGKHFIGGKIFFRASHGSHSSHCSPRDAHAQRCGAIALTTRDTTQQGTRFIRVREACKRRSRRACDALVGEAKRRERIAGATCAAPCAWQQHRGFVFKHRGADDLDVAVRARMRASACAHVTCAHRVRPAIARGRCPRRRSTCNAKPTVPSRRLRTRGSDSSNRATCGECVRGARGGRIIARDGHSRCVVVRGPLVHRCTR